MSNAKSAARKARKKKDRQAKIRQQAHVKKAAAGKKSVAEEVHTALLLIDQGNINGGSQILERLRKKTSKEPLLDYGMGVLFLKKGQPEKAVDWFEKAVEASPDHLEAHYNLAVAYQKINDIPGMVMAYQHVIEKGEKDSYPVNMAASNLARLEKSLKERDGIGLTEFIEGHLYFKKGLDLMGERSWDEAVDAFHQAIRVHPKSVQSHGNLGICYAILGKKTDALAAFDMALEIDPDYEMARVHRERVAAIEEGQRLDKGGAVMKGDFENK